jgi:predicted nucleic acid-binding Zn ribbon protein
MNHCTFCGAPHSRKAVYCSRKCHDRLARRRWRNNLRARIKARLVEPKPCAACGKVFPRRNINQRYCCQKCRPVATRASAVSPWTSVCEICGHSGTRLHRHHITPRGEGGPDTRGNLAMLCARCHSEVHRSAMFRYIGPPGREDFISLCKTVL